MASLFYSPRSMEPYKKPYCLYIVLGFCICCNILSFLVIRGKNVYMTHYVELYWHYVVNASYTTVLDFRLCPTHDSLHRHKNEPGLFSLSGSLQFAPMDISRTLPKASPVINIFLHLPAGTWSYQGQVSVIKVTRSYSASSLIDHSIILYGAPTPLLTDNWLQFAFSLSKAVFEYLHIRHLTTNVYHSQTRVQGKRFSKTIVARLRNSMANLLIYRDPFV